MPFPLIPIALGLAEFVPTIARWIGGDDAGDIAGKAVDVAKKVAGVEDPDDALEKIRRDPELQIRYQRAMAPVVIAQMEADTRKLEAVNATMRAESASRDVYVRRWRPTWGYVTAAAWALQAVAVFVVAAGAVWATFDGVEPELIAALFDGLAGLIGAMTAVWTIALGVLGINVAKRTEDKRVAAGAEPSRSILGAVAERIAGVSKSES